MEKICLNCNSKFNTISNKKIYCCRDCKNKYCSKKYRENNKDYLKQYNKTYQKDNKDKINTQRLEYRKANRVKLCNASKQWIINNKQKKKEYDKKYRKQNLEKLLIKDRDWYKNNKNRYNTRKKAYNKKKRKEDKIFLLKDRMRGRLNKFLKKKNWIKTSSTFKMIGCTPQELKQHLEKQFTDGMSWANRGDWHIDHIIPLASAESEKDLIRLCHYTNLQPLWAEDNLKKGCKQIT